VNEAPRRLAELQVRYEAGQLSFDEMVRQVQAVRDNEFFTHNGQTLHIKRVAHHYYVPVLISESERIDWIRHVIRHPSEVDFLNALEAYLKEDNNAFKQLDWWAFSKIDETLDEVYIPYYDPHSNRIRRFLPDFIFWLQKGNNYSIVFVDPKGTQHTEYQHKIDGYCALFREKDKQKIFCYENLQMKIHLILYTSDASKIPKNYQDYWFGDLKKIPELCLGAMQATGER